MILQQAHEIIDISDWGQMSKEPFRQGSREKTKIISPGNTNHSFIKHKHPYLYKLPNHRYPWQFWMEIIAYRIGLLMDVVVPPAHIAKNSHDGSMGALIEWFYNNLFQPEIYSFHDGGEIFRQAIIDFDNKTGKQHNFRTMKLYCDSIYKEPSIWLKEISKIFCFDALIGNTDRHQENWGIIFSFEEKNGVYNMRKVTTRFSPAYDNGTSLGHEIVEEKIANKTNGLDNYIYKGRHHIKWDLESKEKLGHFEIITKLIQEFPQTLPWLKECLNFPEEKISDTIVSLKDFNRGIISEKYQLSQKRIDFMIKLTNRRRQLLLKTIDNATH